MDKKELLKLIKLIKRELKKPDLTPRERAILAYRFGFIDGITHTLEETGKLFGVTRERIRQIETKALEKIKGRKKIIKE